MKKLSDKLPKILFYISLAVAIYVYGILSYLYYLYPYPLLLEAVRSVKALRTEIESSERLYSSEMPAAKSTADQSKTVLATTHKPEQLSQGLILVAGVD